MRSIKMAKSKHRDRPLVATCSGDPLPVSRQIAAAGCCSFNSVVTAQADASVGIQMTPTHFPEILSSFFGKASVSASPWHILLCVEGTADHSYCK